MGISCSRRATSSTPTLPSPSARCRRPDRAANSSQLTNNVTLIRSQSDIILVEHRVLDRVISKPQAGPAENLKAAGIQPSAVTTVVLTHGHPDHLWGVLDASDNQIYPNASYVVSAREWDVWAAADVLLPPVFAETES